MKYIIVACLLLVSSAVFAQKNKSPSPKPGVEASSLFKGANVIVVHTSDSAKVALRKVAISFQQHGFVIDRMDYDLLSLSTKPKPFARSSSHTMQATAVAEQGIIKLGGLWHGELGAIHVDEQAGYTNAASKAAFAEIEAVAKDYPNASIGYLLRP
jgi:uncharacterized protein YukE